MTYQFFSPEAEAAIKKAMEPISDSRMSGWNGPEGGETYDCESCPASFGFQPEDFKCPLCQGRLTGEATVHFYPPYEDDEE